jgi:hypothetical protein
MPSYESDIGRFLREMKSSDPTLEAGQKLGRAIWWDKQIEPELYRRFRESAVPQNGYVYQSAPKGRR